MSIASNLNKPRESFDFLDERDNIFLVMELYNLYSGFHYSSTKI